MMRIQPPLLILKSGFSRIHRNWEPTVLVENHFVELLQQRHKILMLSNPLKVIFTYLGHYRSIICTCLFERSFISFRDLSRGLLQRSMHYMYLPMEIYVEVIVTMHDAVHH